MAKAKIIALEWDNREARVAVATARGTGAVVEDAFAIDLAAPNADDTSLGPEAIGRRLAESLAQRGVTASETLVALGRTSIELRSLALPPVPPNELPDMVRFQAMQAFAGIGEDWPLDFVELETHGEGTSVLAAVVAPRQVQLVREACQAGGLTPSCLVLRPFAAASLLRRDATIDTDRNLLVVDLLPDGADLIAVIAGQVVFMRTVRSPAGHDVEVQSRALAGELRRTIGAAQNQMGGRRIEQIVLLGAEMEHTGLQQSLAQTLSLEVISCDPFQCVSLAGTLQPSPPDNSGRFAPLLGMIADHVAGERHAIDFLNPRKRPVPPSRRRRTVVLTAAVALVCGVIALAVGWKLKQFDAEIAALQIRSADLEEVVERARTLVAKAEAVQEFTDGDITWLDEIREVAVRIPGPEHVILDDLTVKTELGPGGAMTLRGSVRTAAVIAQFEDSLRYHDNVVAGRYSRVDSKRRDYPYMIDTSVTVVPDRYEQGRSRGRPFRDAAPQPPPAEVPDEAEQTGPPMADSSGPDAPRGGEEGRRTS
jgi:Tfp pilus assembly PilM family ATPase